MVKVLTMPKVEDLKVYGRPAPDWIRETECCLEGATDWSLIASFRPPFNSHVEPSEECFKRHLALGVRPIPYVTLYQAPMNWTFQGITLREHTDFIEIDEDGNWKRSGFWDSEDSKNWYTLCPAVEGVQEALVNHVTHLMEMGAAGIFIDNLGWRRRCFGPEYGVHSHVSDDPQKAFELLMKRVYEAVKSFGDDKVVIGNPGSVEALDPNLWNYLDVAMKESYICTWVSKDRLWGGTWYDWYKRDIKCKPITEAGKKIWALSYLGHTSNPIKDDAYYCYATARLHNFIWSAGGNELAKDPAKVLIGIRLGQPLDDEREVNGVHYRVYENGLVAVNPTDGLKVLEVPYPKAEVLYDLYEEKEIPTLDGVFKAEIPPDSGRVYMDSVRPRSTVNRENSYFLLIETEPRLGGVCFKVDGVPIWTHSGRWKITYEKGEQFGRVILGFKEKGLHTVEIVDVEAKPLQTPAGYGTRERLGKFMDPARPTEIMRPDQAYRFVGWAGASESTEKRITLHVPHRVEEELGLGRRNMLYTDPRTKVTRLIARFEASGR